MPGSAITAGCVDFVLPPEGMARELSRVAGHPLVAPLEPAEPERPAELKVFEEILHALRQRTGVDFTHYKRATLQRRIQRRMVLHKFESLKEYAALLRSSPREIKELYNDILIHVTGFFRDPAAFQALKRRILPRLLKTKSPEDPIRIWVPGCSTGEEVYSLAIALVEFLAERKAHNPVQIFGTDINDTALEKARAGFYSESVKADVAAERLRRFFVKADGGLRINKAVREMCIFARQNLVVDPPFSNLDLISCRNVLIYLNALLQRKVMPLFHYALKPAGYLLLGASETVGGFQNLFSLVDKKAKLYSKKTTFLRPAVTFGHGLPELPAAGEAITAAPAPAASSLAEVQKQADRILLSHFSPAGVIINQHLDVLQFRGRTGLYLEHSHGEASLNLLRMAREGLMLDLRTVTARAIKQNARARQEGVRVRQNGQSLVVNLEVIPFLAPPSTEKFYLVLFEPARRSGPPAAADKIHTVKAARGRTGKQEAELRRLRDELAATRESLQSISEEQEATSEEFRSANEEIMSSNEELQSTNEELETAKEELQSTNEELTTLNDELESRNTEVEHVNNDLQNLLASVHIPILMLGQDLRIRRFTGVAEKMFNLIPADIGRPITDIKLPIEIPGLDKLVMEVIDTLATKDLELQDQRGHWWSVRIRPYKTTDNMIDGAVLVLVDIDVLKTSMEQINDSRLLAEGMVDAVREPMLVLNANLSVQSANRAFYETFRVTPEDTINHRIYNLGNGQWDIPRLRTLLEEILPSNTRLDGFRVEHQFPRIGFKQMLVNARRLSGDEKKTRLILLAIQDVTEKEEKTKPADEQ